MENFLIDKYNCTVPLTMEGLNMLCPIFDENRNHSYDDMLYDAHGAMRAHLGIEINSCVQRSQNV